MSYISEILDRVDVEKIGHFFLCDEIPKKTGGDNYEKRLDSAYDDIMDYLKEKYSSEKEYLEIESRVNAFARIHENVFMEIGMRCGARLMSVLTEKQ